VKAGLRHLTLHIKVLFNAPRDGNAPDTIKKLKMNTGEKLRVHKMLSAITIVIGLVLLIYMIIVESEPGAIPLLLVVLGTGWYFITRARTRSHRQ
jgi:hypothetical protein